MKRILAVVTITAGLLLLAGYLPIQSMDSKQETCLKTAKAACEQAVKKACEHKSGYAKSACEKSTRESCEAAAKKACAG